LVIRSPADPDLTEVPESRLSRWQLIQSLQRDFWKRWSKEYIAELQRCATRKKPTGSITVDTIVLIKEDNLLPLKWRLGRAVAI